MKLTTWNINGIRARHPRVLAWVERHQPDVLCLQEIKTVDEGFPREPYEQLGYTVATFGQKAYNGVAILSKFPLADVVRGFQDDEPDPQARCLAATVQNVRILCLYVPNGEGLTSEKFGYKLKWLTRLREVARREQAAHPQCLLCGDFNVAPADQDVYDPEGWRESVLCSSAERRGLQEVCDIGLVDALRHMHPQGEFYTWWDYRAGGFPRNRGLRIDHVYVTPGLLASVRGVTVDREERAGSQPSDHAPVTIEWV